MIQKLQRFVKDSLEKMNDPDIKEIVESPMISGSEDFAYYARKNPWLFL